MPNSIVVSVAVKIKVDFSQPEASGEGSEVNVTSESWFSSLSNTLAVNPSREAPSANLFQNVMVYSCPTVQPSRSPSKKI